MLLLFIFALGTYAPMRAMDNNNNTNSMLTFARDVTVGTIAATTECTVSHPLTIIKYRLQQGDKLRQINFNTRFLYTGFGLNIASMAPTTALQFGIEGVFKKLLPDHPSKPMLSACGAGICSAVVSSPIELMVVHLQNEEKRRLATDATKPKLTAHQIIRGLVLYGGYPVLSRGMLPKALREGGFATGLLWGNGKIKDYLQRAVGNGVAATIGASLVTGLGVTVVTHPFDTISTIMQEGCNVTSSAPRKQQVTTMRQAARTIYQQGKLRGFYKGFAPRVIFVTTAIGVMDKVRHDLTAYANRLME
jgi:hypothetical protein